MANEAKPRAVSGEIMTDLELGAARGTQPAHDIIDAEYIRLPSEPLHAQSTSSDGTRLPEIALSIGSAAAPSGGMNMLRRPDMPPARRKPARSGPFFWATGVGIAIAAFWVSGGHALVRGMPYLGTASQSALRISGVTSRVDASGLHATLSVDGEAVNDGQAVEHLPALEIAVTGNDGRITRYRLGTSGRPLSSGEIFAFSSRLDLPKNGVKTVSVAFAE